MYEVGVGQAQGSSNQPHAKPGKKILLSHSHLGLMQPLASQHRPVAMVTLELGPGEALRNSLNTASDHEL